MADAKIEELNELLAPADDDEIVIDDVTATRETKRIKVQNFLSALEYGELYVQDGSGSQTMSSGGYTKINQFLTNGLSSDHITPDHTSDVLTVSRTGVYSARFSISFTGTNGVVWDVALFLDGVETHIEVEHTIVASVRISGGAQGYLDVTGQPVDVDLRAKPDGASKDIEVLHASITLERIAGT